MTREGWLDAARSWLTGSSTALLMLAASIVALYVLALVLLLPRAGQRTTARPSSNRSDEGLIADAPAVSSTRAVPAWASRRGRPAFLATVALVAVTLWLTAALLAPDLQRFLASPEWHAQPAYLFAHAATVRIFASLLAQNHLAGAAHLNVDGATITTRVRYLLSTVMPFGALFLATPFILMDLRFFLSADYPKLSGSTVATVADWIMFAIWCLEWLLNAMVWVMLIGFVRLNVQALTRYAFRAPIHAVVAQRHYRPFLRMSAQGATVLFMFSLATAFYILYAGGTLSDYLGLVITIVLLPACFVPPWIVVRRKVNDLVTAESDALHAVVIGLPSQTPGSDPRPTAERDLADAVAMIRLMHLERLHDSVGRREAAAVMLRLVAPAATIGWQIWQNGAQILDRALTFLRGLG